ncbi:hypothetical protein DESA109040_02470 [Deinococcus saxicola]|uniref:hypothetical protein n=1 Tax=Deinococcus saxicola TaxID=249406 RepID=UPI0039EF6972
MKKSLMTTFALSLLSAAALFGGASAADVPLVKVDGGLPTAASLPDLPNLVRFYTDGLKDCAGGGQMMASLGAAVQVEAQVTAGVLDTSTVKLARTQLLAPVVISAGASDRLAGLTVPYGEAVTLTLKCGDGYAATTFTPRSALDLRFTFGQPAEDAWKVWVGEVPGILGLRRK